MDVGTTRSTRLHSLDALRTIAALAVFVEHWPQHFFSTDRFAQPLESAPLYRWLSFVYNNGASAVTFFFCLSGFIFYWLYAEAVFSGHTTFRKFSLLRISRLYPLHLATLLLLVGLQPIIHALLSGNFVYQHNDVYHFILNLFFLQCWGFESGYSWNGPSWSISVEIALYALFFIACRKFRPGIIQCLVLILVSLPLARFSFIASSAVAFFAGGIAYYIFLMARPFRSGRNAIAAVSLTFFVWLLFAPLNDKVTSSVVVELIRHSAGDILARIVEIFCGRVREFVLFPTAIFAFSFLESSTPAWRWRVLGGIGNISFGVYLLHYPLQCVAICIAAALSLPADTFASTTTFIVLVAALLIAATASFRWLERPTMIGLRGKWRDEVALGRLVS
jgi:peptidoglycan/LPS O-acetylase OafA/YrhL